MKRALVLALALVMLVSAAACSKRDPNAALESPGVSDAPSPSPSPTPTPTPSPSPTPTPTPTPTPEPLKYRNPLSGEPIAEPHTARPTMVMLNNHRNAQPQCSTTEADIIVEILAEGGVTRMVGLYSDISRVEGEIGSVRSIRTYYVDIGLAFDAITVHAGGSEGGIARLRQFGVDRICGVQGPTDPDTFYRREDRMAGGVEHSMFTTGDRIYAFAEKQGYELTIDESYDCGLRFTDDPVPEDGESAKKIDITFILHSKYTNFTYDAGKGVYTIFQMNDDYHDGNTGELVEIDNVIILYAVHRNIDGEGRRDVTLTGGGEGYYACGGKYVPITWSRENDTAPFRYFNADGSELEIGAGKTYIAIVPTTGSEIIFE